MRSIRFWVMATLLVTGGCASAPATRDEPLLPEERAAAAPKTSEAPAPVAPATPQAFDARGFANGFPRAADCESAARTLQPRSPDMAWAALKACVEKNDFTLINRLVEGAWDQDLQTRPEASVVLAKVIARRGGDVEGDLARMREHRVPLFSLGAALAQPATYKGRMVLMRGKVSEMKTQGGKPVVMLAETSLGSMTSDVEVGMAHSSSSRAQVSGRADYKTTRYGSGTVSGSAQGSSSSRDVNTRQVHENVVRETGRQALGRLAKPDPFLEPEHEFIILARFDGVRTTSRSEADTEEAVADKMAVIAIVGYFAPNALVLE